MARVLLSNFFSHSLRVFDGLCNLDCLCVSKEDPDIFSYNSSKHQVACASAQLLKGICAVTFKPPFKNWIARLSK